MKGFYHIWTWRQSLSCDTDAMNRHSFPLTIEAPQCDIKFGSVLPSGYRGEDVDDDDWRRTDARPWVNYKLTYR